MIRYKIVWIDNDAIEDVLSVLGRDDWRVVHVELIGSRYRVWLERHQETKRAAAGDF